MATQVSPGVRITEVDNTLAIAQAAPPAGAIAGPFSWGPVEQVLTVGSEDELVRMFGKPDAQTANYFFTGANFLAYSNTLRVVRVVDATKALAASSNASSTVLSDTIRFTINTTSTTMTSSADASALLFAGATLNIANGVSGNVRVTVASVTNGTTFTLTAIPSAAVTTANAYKFGAYVKNDDHYEATFSNGTTATTGPWSAKYVGALGNSLRVELCGGVNAFSLSYAQATANLTVTSGVNVTVSNNVTDTLTVGDIITANSQDRRVTAVNSSTITVNSAFSGTLSGASFSRKWAYASLFSAAPGTSSFASRAGGANDELHAVVIDTDGLISGTANTVLEIYPFVSKARDAKTETGSSNYYKEVINRQSPYIWWMSHPASASGWGETASGRTFNNLNTIERNSLFGGVDGTAVADADVIRGYDLFLPEQVEISFLLGGPANTTVATHLLSNIVGVKNFVMAFLSPEYTDVVNNTPGNEVTDVIGFRAGLPSTSYAVLDSGWKYQYDKYNDLYRYVPLNGDVAGCAVRTDQTADPWFSPAGLTRGQIKNVIKLAWNPSQADRDSLYTKGINPVVTFPGQGTVLYGDKTLLTKPSAFDRINVRRLFINLQQVIDGAAKQLLFEQNDEFSRNTFVNLVEPYLRQVKGRRGISDFVVVCDSTNNPPDAVDRNEFRGDIYVKPIRSINYIQLNIVAVRSDVAFNEVITNLQ